MVENVSRQYKVAKLRMPNSCSTGQASNELAVRRQSMQHQRFAQAGKYQILMRIPIPRQPGVASGSSGSRMQSLPPEPRPTAALLVTCWPDPLRLRSVLPHQ